MDVPGILDMKFNPELVGNHHVLAAALSDGTLTMLPLDLSDLTVNVWKNNERLLIDSESTICLSVDWSNQMNPDPNLRPEGKEEMETLMCLLTQSVVF